MLDGSTASTATRRPRPISSSPSASMNVDLPDPGDPLIPTRIDLPVCGKSASSTPAARLAWSARVDSTSVMAFPRARGSPSSTPSTSARSIGSRAVLFTLASSLMLKDYRPAAPGNASSQFIARPAATLTLTPPNPKRLRVNRRPVAGSLHSRALSETPKPSLPPGVFGGLNHRHRPRGRSPMSDRESLNLSSPATGYD